MTELPPVRYINAGGESIAYRHCGGSGLPIVYLGTYGSHQDLMWDDPGYAHFLRSLVALGQLLTFDRRGSGLSSRTVRPTIEARVADVERVLDVAAIDHAVLVATGGSTQAALSFGAMRPDRTRAIVLHSPVARMNAVPGYDIGVPPDIVQETIRQQRVDVGHGDHGAAVRTEPRRRPRVPAVDRSHGAFGGDTGRGPSVGGDVQPERRA